MNAGFDVVQMIETPSSKVYTTSVKRRDLAFVKPFAISFELSSLTLLLSLSDRIKPTLSKLDVWYSVSPCERSVSEPRQILESEISAL